MSDKTVIPDEAYIAAMAALDSAPRHLTLDQVVARAVAAAAPYIAAEARRRDNRQHKP